MRNLKLSYERCVTQVVQNACNITGPCLDCDHGVCYYITDNGLLGFSMLTGTVLSAVDLRADGLLSAGSDIIAAHYQPDYDSSEADAASISIATSNGDLLVWHTSTSQVECVGSVESGLLAMSWSPDGELLVLFTGADTIILMTRQFDPVTEVGFHQQQFGTAEFVTVGWGKKETQFHGSEGKQAALKRAEVTKDLVPWDDRKPRVRWRGDGQYFVVSAVDVVEGARKLRVWGREGVLHSTSQALDGCLEQALDWKPSGSLIASSQRRLQKHDIIFFECNGLRHGEFSLPFGPGEVQVRAVQWNSDSSVLLVWCEEATESKSSHIQLWTVGNYHWYLKQSLCSGRILSVMWDAAVPLRLHVVTADATYTQYNWSWTTCAATGSRADVGENGHGEESAVAVVDGVKLLVTPFGRLVVPPPMCAYSLQLETPASNVAFAPPSARSSLLVAAVTGDKLVAYGYGCESSVASTAKPEAAGGKNFRIQCRMPNLQGTFRMTADGLPAGVSSVRHLTWLSSQKLAYVTLARDFKCSSWCKDRLFIVSLKESECNKNLQQSLSVEQTVDLDKTVLCMAATSFDQGVSSCGLVLQLLDGSLIHWSQESGLTLWTVETSGRSLKFPVPCPDMAVCTFAGKRAVVGLSETYRCFVDEVEIATDCTSFAVHEDFLLITTYTHSLRCIRRCSAATTVIPQLDGSKAWPFDESIRRVERGSRIVTVVPDDTTVVLQMPRGNLEAIHPRALVLATVRRKLDALVYQEAFMLVRRHRINMNLIYDHSPQTFLANTTVFVDQVQHVQYLNEFITDLQNENVCLTMYSSYYVEKPAMTSGDASDSQSTPPSSSTARHKIDVVCDALLDVFTTLDADKYTLAILTAYAKKTAPELEKALFLIQTLKTRHNAALAAEEAIKYLLFLVDVHELYNVALGTYDFDLALMVAERSNMDPKEYLPFLNEVRPLEANYQRYTIDRHLRRFEKALLHITKCGPERFSECLKFVAGNSLYSAAMKLFSPTSQEYKDIVMIYCEHLARHKQHEEAGLLYMQVAEHQQALECFRECCAWQQAITAAHMLGPSASPSSAGFAALCRGMAENLRRRKQFFEAARLLELYVKDEEECVACLVEGGHWEDALRVIHSYNRADLEVTHLKPAIVTSHRDMLSQLLDNIETFDKYASRLLVVRTEKAKAAVSAADEDGAGQDTAGDDLFSDTSSTVASRSARSSSARSKSTGRSSKNRRKAERKKWSLKEGSPYEEVALLEALKHLVQQIDASRDDVGCLLRMLVLYGHMAEAGDLQKTYENALVTIGAKLPIIWAPDTWLGCQLNATMHHLCSATGNGSSAASVQLMVARRRDLPADGKPCVLPDGDDGGGGGSAAQKEEERLVRIPPVLNKIKTWKLSILSEQTKVVHSA